LVEPVVIAYERIAGPGPHRMSYVLFSDFHVVIINEGKLQEELVRTRQAAKSPSGRPASAPTGTH
jgi:hypothetical protein